MTKRKYTKGWYVEKNQKQRIKKKDEDEASVKQTEWIENDNCKNECTTLNPKSTIDSSKNEIYLESSDQKAITQKLGSEHEQYSLRNSSRNNSVLIKKPDFESSYFLKKKYKKRKWKPWPESEATASILLLSTFFSPGYIFTVGIPLVGAILSFSCSVYAAYVMITKPRKARDRKKNMTWLCMLFIGGIINGILCIAAL